MIADGSLCFAWGKRNRRPLLQSLVRSCLIIIGHVLVEHTPHMTLTHEEEVIQAFFSNRANPPLSIGVRVRLWGSVKASEPL
jgi:hypothetical protein